MRLVILGGPGSGRGTQSDLLARYLGSLWIATGDILRLAVSTTDADGDSQTELGRQAQAYVERGELVPDEVMIRFIRLRLCRPDTAGGWILDGYPRTAFQAEELDFLLEDLGQQIDQAIYLEVPDAILMQRSVATHQLDSQPEAVQRRIDLFHERTQPLLEYYEFRNRLIRIAGDSAIATIHQEILKKLGC